MHIVIGLITALGGLFWALNSLQRSGFSISSINPFLWYRRYQWRKSYGQNPVYTLDKPMDAAAVVLLGAAKLEGEISKELKCELLTIFSQEFNLNTEKAKELFAATSFLLQHESHFLKNVDKILETSLNKFSTEQRKSIIELVLRVVKVDSEISSEQKQLVDTLNKLLLSNNDKGKW